MVDVRFPFAFVLLILPFIFFAARKKYADQKFSLRLCLDDWRGERFTYNSVFCAIMSRLCAGLLLCAYAAFVTALSQPRVITREKIYTSRGADILFMLDVSPSMAAADAVGGKTRLSGACQIIKEFAENREGDAIGLGIIGSDAALALPPTSDRLVLYDRLAQLSPGLIGGDTALGDGLALGAAHLASGFSENSILILLTDGENNAGAVNPLTAAALIKEKNLTFYIVGIGTSGEAPIDYVDFDTGKRYSGYYESSFNDAALRSLAFAAGGTYVAAENFETLAAALQNIDRSHQSSARYFFKNNEKDYAPLFLAAAMVCFCAAWILRRFALRSVL